MRIFRKKVYRIFFLGLLLVFLLNTVALADDTLGIETHADDNEYWLKEIHRYLSEVREIVEACHAELCSQGVYIEDIYSLFGSWSSVFSDIQTSLDSMNINTTKLIIPYLETISYSLNNSGSSVAMYLESINTKLDTLIVNQGGSLDISGVLGSLDTIVFNQQDSLKDLDSIISNQQVFLIELDTMISNQQALLALLQKEGAFTTDISGVLADLDTMIKNQQDLLALMQKDGAFTTDISGVLTALDTMISNQSKLLALLDGEDSIGLDLFNILYYQEQLHNNLEAFRTDFRTALYHNDRSLGSYLNSIADDLHYMRDIQYANSLRLIEIVQDLSYAENSVAKLLTQINGKLGSAQTYQNSVLANQQDILALLQENVAVSFDTTTLENKIDEVTTALTDNLVYGDYSVSQLLYYIDTSTSSVLSRMSRILSSLSELVTNTGDISGIFANQQEILTLLQEDGTFALALSDVLTNQQEAISQLTDNHVAGTLAYNVSRAVDLLAELDNISISGDLSLGDVAFDTTALETRLDELNVSLSANLVYGKKSAASYLSQIANNFNSTASPMNRLFSLLTAQLSGGSKSLTSNVESLTTMQEELIDLIEDLNVTTVENIENITVEVTNEAYEIFYITDGEGNEQNLGEFSGDVLTIGGRLLNFFFRAAFDGALDSVDAALDDMTDFYIDDSVVLEGGSLWD